MGGRWLLKAGAAAASLACANYQAWYRQHQTYAYLCSSIIQLYYDARFEKGFIGLPRRAAQSSMSFINNFEATDVLIETKCVTQLQQHAKFALHQYGFSQVFLTITELTSK